MAAPHNWRGEFRGVGDDDFDDLGTSRGNVSDDALNRSTSKLQGRDKDKEWEGESSRFTCLLTLRHGTGREQRYGPRFRMLGCCYNHDGIQICTASEDRSCRIYDRISKQPQLKLIHNELVRCAAISHSGRYVCTGSDDQYCRMFPIFPEEDHPELKKGEELYSLHHAGWLTSITFAKNDSLLLTTARDRVARIWDIGKMDLRMPTTKWKLEDPIHHAAFNPDQTRLAFASGAQRYFGLVSVFHVEKGQVDGGGNQATPPLSALEHPDCVTCVAFSPNNRYLGSGCLDGEARVFDTRIFDQVCTFKHPNFIRTVTFTQCNKCICTACEDGCIRIFNIALRKELQCFQTGEPLTCLVMAPGGLEVCCCTSEGQLQIWGVEGRMTRRLKDHMRSLEEAKVEDAPETATANEPEGTTGET